LLGIPSERECCERLLRSCALIFGDNAQQLNRLHPSDSPSNRRLCCRSAGDNHCDTIGLQPKPSRKRRERHQIQPTLDAVEQSRCAVSRVSKSAPQKFHCAYRSGGIHAWPRTPVSGGWGVSVSLSGRKREKQEGPLVRKHYPTHQAWFLEVSGRACCLGSNGGITQAFSSAQKISVPPRPPFG